MGLDGERLDTILGTEKPAIPVVAGTILASSERALLSSDTTFEWIHVMPIPSPLGDVVVVRAQAFGHVLLAGVRQRQHVAMVMQHFADLQCDVVLVDGALNRIAAAAPSLVDATIVACGAVAGRTVENVADAAADFLVRFRLPVANLLLQRQLGDAADDCIAILGASGGETIRLPRYATSEAVRTAVAALAQENPLTISIPGAVADGLLLTLLALPRHLVIVARHPAQILASTSVLKRWFERGNQMSTWTSLPVAALAVNPHHIQGYDLPEKELFAAMCRLFPDETVWNAMSGEVRWP